MGRVPAPVRNRGRAQLLDAPGAIHILDQRLTDVLYGVPKGATCEETLESLEDCFGDQHLVAAYRSQLKTRTQDVGGTLKAFDTVVEQLAHLVYPALP
jgi:hypothetical protein